MSRKTRRNQPNPAPAPAAVPARRISRTGLFVGAAFLVGIAFAVAVLMTTNEKVADRAPTVIPAELTRAEAPAFGNPQALVHLVEFLDPACEACAAIYPHVKALLAAHPDRLRVSVRHVAFHQGADFTVRILEASRQQGLYAQTLEALLASQPQWTANHVVQPDRVWAAIARVGLDLAKLRADMDSPQVTQRMAQDLADAKALLVARTPQFFVNGRPLLRFGLQELQDLVQEAVLRAYP